MGFLSKIFWKIDGTVGKKLFDKVGMPAYMAGERMKIKTRIVTLQREEERCIQEMLTKPAEAERLSRRIEEINKELEQLEEQLKILSKSIW